MTEKLDEFDSIQLLAAKKRWEKEGISLRLGIEADYFVGQEAGTCNTFRGKTMGLCNRFCSLCGWMGL